MKRKLLFAAALVAGALSFEAQAQTWVPSEVGEGDFYLYNVGAGKFLNAGDRGAQWGTNACLTADYGLDFALIANGNGYSLDSKNYNGKDAHFLGTSMWTDGSATAWVFTNLGDNVYTISNEDKYLVANAAGDDVELSTSADSENAKWKLATRTAIIADLLTATKENPKNARILIAGSDFNRNDSRVNTVNSSPAGNKKWTWTNSGGNVTVAGPNAQRGTYGCEFWNNTFDISQTLTNIPNGTYEFKISGYGTNGTTVIYANGVEKPFVNQTSAANFGAALDNIADGQFTGNTTGEIVVKTGSLQIGVKRTTNSSADWTVIDNADLIYYGPLDLTETIEAYESALSNANTIAASTSKYEATLLAPLNTAISTYSSVDKTNQEALEEATNALNAATNDVKASITAYESAEKYFNKMKGILDNTNVYTEEAYNAVYGTWLAAYEANTLETATAATLTENSAYSTDWHSTNNIDEILLSTWTIGGEQAKNYDKALYINTWSTEGNNDGSEFTTPFFEYWTGDDNSLGANTLVSKVTGLKAKTNYSYTIRARVRQTNNKTKIAEGIMMKVGDGTAVDISAGTQFNGGVFYIGNFSAVGQTDAEGTLTTTITVAENSNISWLSFYNCKYVEGEDLFAYIADYEFALDNVNTALTEDVAYVTMQGDLKTAAETYANVDKTDKDALIAAKEALKDVLAAYNEVVAPLKGNNLTGWETTGNNGQFHVNTWSGEGKTDGSNMTTPFTENWISQGTSLTDATMSHTIEGLAAGYYKVTALIRSLNEAGGATPTGSYIFANDGIARAFEGTACTNGVYDNPVVYGLVGEDGKLTIGVKIIDANVNWVSWKNFSYEYVGATLADAATMTVNAEAKYATFCAPFEVAIPEGVTAYTIDGIEANGSTLTLTEVKVTIPANTPVVLNSEAAVNKEIKGVAVDGTPTAGLLTGVYTNTTITEGYVLQNQAEKGLGFYAVSGSKEVGANRAYLTVPAPTAKEFFFPGNNATAIEAISALANSEIEGIYTIGGAKVNSLQKGINIVKMQNGATQKVYVK